MMSVTKKDCIPYKIHGAEFVLTIGCKLNCHYCPQEKLIRKYVELYGNNELCMTFDTFKTCLDKIECGSGVHFGGMSEAFQNKECSRMIKYAYDTGHKVSIDTTLYGATEDDFELLKDVPIDHIQLHIPDKNNNSNFLITEEYLRVFKLFNDHFRINGYSCHGEVHDDIKNYLKKNIQIANEMMNRAGNLEYEELKTYNHKGRLVCANGSVGYIAGWLPEILPNGTVLLCCMDYGMEHILGNLVTESWNEILNGKEFLAYEKGLDDERISILCRQCPAAMQKDDKRFEHNKLLGPNAIRIARIIENYRDNKIDAYAERDIAIIEQLGQDNVCLFGLGKLFEDNYYQSLWHNVIQANIFCDNREELWGEIIHGIKCISPAELSKVDKLTVVTYVTDDSDIRQQLRDLGIENIINIFEIFNLCD